VQSLNSRSFFARWQALHAASNPGLLKDRWQFDGVIWTKERHNFWGERYSFQLEVHRLEQAAGTGKPGWTLLVVIERWWGPDRDKSIRESHWCRALKGKAERILAWMKKAEAGA